VLISNIFFSFLFHILQQSESNSVNGFPSLEHATRHRLFKVLKNLQEKVKYQHTKFKATPHDHDTLLGQFKINADDVLSEQKKRRNAEEDDDDNIGDR
jgi:hypothetical protein